MEEFQDIVDAKKRKCNAERSLLNAVSSPAFLSPYSCVGVLFILLRVSGFPILSHYTASFLERTGMKLDSLLVALIIGIVRFTFSLLAFVFLSLISRRTAFIVCGSLGTLGMLTSE